MDSLIFVAMLCPSLPIIWKLLWLVGWPEGRDGHNVARNVKESIYIRVNNPTLNNNIGKINLSHIWDRVLLNTKGLTLNKQGNNNNN